MGIDVTDGWDSAIQGGFASVKFSENNLGNSGNNNPNSLVEATEVFRIPLNPVYNEVPIDTELGSVGVCINGIPIYNPFEDRFETSAYGRIFSSCCGHPQRNGKYHYHKYPTCLKFLQGSSWTSEKDKCDALDALLESNLHSPLIGFALDGWPIYGPVGWLDDNRNSILLKTSYTGSDDAAGNPTYVDGSGDLDICNGIISPTPEFPEGIYHYVMSIKADNDGTVFRYINPYFGYDVRNTLNKHSLMPSSWEDDSAYITSIKNGFSINQITIPGTDDYNTFVEFIEGMIVILENNGLGMVADEFQTMQIDYPYTIRCYRGNPTSINNNSPNNNYISPLSGQSGETISMTITLNNNDFGRPVPPLQNNQGVIIPINSIDIGEIDSSNISSITRVSRFVISFDLYIPNSVSSEIVDITVSFLGPSGNTPTFVITNGFEIN